MRRIVYLISPNKIYKNFYNDLKKTLALKNVKFFQVRLKKVSKNKVKQVSKKVKSITKKFGVKLIINDNPEIAKQVGADGCHIGQSDMNIVTAKNYLKNKIIGVTCHNSKGLAVKAIANNAGYLAFGSFYKSKLKPKAIKSNLKILRWAKKKVKKPVVVIGGINDKNYKKLINLGANYIAISSYIWDNPELKPEQAIKKFKWK